MANQILANARLWMGAYDLSGKLNRAAVDYSAELHDDTALSATARSRLAGLVNAALQAEGYWEAGTAMPDDMADGYLALADVPVSACAVAGAAEGSRAFTFQAALGEFQRGAQIGEIFKFSAGAEGSGGKPMVRGLVLHNATETGSGNATGYQLGALGATQHLFAALHVLSLSGTDTPTLTVKIQSDDNGSFTSATDRITFAAKTAVGYEWASVAGAVTDDYWRANFTLSGTNPSFAFVVVAGIATVP